MAPAGHRLQTAQHLHQSRAAVRVRDPDVEDVRAGSDSPVGAAGGNAGSSDLPGHERAVAEAVAIAGA